jgi:hypothetical protein
VTTDQVMTGAQFLSRYPSSIPAEEVLLINGIESTTSVPKGTTLKRITGGVQ